MKTSIKIFNILGLIQSILLFLITGIVSLIIYLDYLEFSAQGNIEGATGSVVSVIFLVSMVCCFFCSIIPIIVNSISLAISNKQFNRKSFIIIGIILLILGLNPIGGILMIIYKEPIIQNEAI